MRPQRLVSLLIGLMALGACATNPRLARLASSEGAMLNEYQSSMDRFAQQQTALDADSDRRITDLDATRTASESRVAERLSSFNLASDKSATDLYQLLNRSAVDVLAGSVVIKETQPAPAAAPVSFDPTQVQALVKELTAVSRTPTVWDQIAASLAYAGELRTAYQASIAKATTASAGAKTAAATVQKTTITAANKAK